MKITLTAFHFEELVKKGYSLDHVFLLRLISEGADLGALDKESAKIAALHQSLIRKGLVTEKDDKLTVIGTELLTFMDSKAPGKMVRRKADDSAFAKWWEAFPPTDIFEFNGMKFTGSRSLRINREECRAKFDKILLEGEYSSEILIAAMQYDVALKKVASYKKKQNKLSYLQNSLTYLNQRSYEPFIEFVKREHDIRTLEIDEEEYDGINL